MRPLDPSLVSLPALAHLCTLTFLKVPELAEDFGHQAAECLGYHAGGRTLQARIDQRQRGPTANAWAGLYKLNSAERESAWF
jgi:hypothetical protein